MALTQTLTIKAQEPFDFDLSAQIFAGGDRQVRVFADGSFSQVINIGGKLILVNMLIIYLRSKKKETKESTYNNVNVDSTKKRCNK